MEYKAKLPRSSSEQFKEKSRFSADFFLNGRFGSRLESQSEAPLRRLQKIEGKEEKQADLGVVAFQPKLIEKIRKQYILQTKAEYRKSLLKAEKEKKILRGAHTNDEQRERFRLMEKTFEEKNSAIMKPIFIEHVTQACEKTVHIRTRLQQEQELLDAMKMKTSKKVCMKDEKEMKESAAQSKKTNLLLSGAGGTVSFEEEKSESKFEHQRDPQGCFYESKAKDELLAIEIGSNSYYQD